MRAFIRIIFIFCINYSFADPLSLETVIKSSRIHYPEIINALQGIKSAQGKAKSALGEFDLNINSKVDSRLEGYYDGDYFDVFLEKPLQYLNSKVYAGYRKSEQDFPSYEGKMKTLDEGESVVGVQLSLLRNRNIDPKRLKLQNSRLKVKESEQDLVDLENKTLKNATKAYWNWASKGFIFNINIRLLKVLKDQGKAIKKNIENGAMARIYLVENLQYIMKQKTEVLKAKQNFEESALVLSLFLRTNDGKPMIVRGDYLPRKIDIDGTLNPETFINKYKNILNLNPKLRKLELKNLQLSNDELLARNSLIPKLDMKFEVSKDNGEGLKSLQGEEQRVMLKVEIPIERNLGKGQVQEIKAKRSIIDRSIKFKQEQLLVKLKKIITRIKTNKEVIQNTEKELEFAKKLKLAEREKFLQGQSDFFVLNMRDQNVVNAEVKLVKTKYDLSKEMAEYRALTMSF